MKHKKLSIFTESMLHLVTLCIASLDNVVFGQLMDIDSRFPLQHSEMYYVELLKLVEILHVYIWVRATRLFIRDCKFYFKAQWHYKGSFQPFCHNFLLLGCLFHLFICNRYIYIYLIKQAKHDHKFLCSGLPSKHKYPTYALLIHIFEYFDPLYFPIILELDYWNVETIYRKSWTVNLLAIGLWCCNQGQMLLN